MTTATVKKTLQEAGVYPDILVKKPRTAKTYIFKKSFFYKMGNSAEGYAELIKKALPASIIRIEDAMKRWPKTSYFIVEFTA